jgi:hypothetical protein
MATLAIEVCPGETRDDYKCNHDETHRVCAKLLDPRGKPLLWGDGDFWKITGQKSFQWDKDIKNPPNRGDSWCICMWATKDLILSAGCDAVHIRCEATDWQYVLQQYFDGGQDLKPAHECLQQKCGLAVTGTATGRKRNVTPKAARPRATTRLKRTAPGAKTPPATDGPFPLVQGTKIEAEGGLIETKTRTPVRRASGRAN